MCNCHIIPSNSLIKAMELIGSCLRSTSYGQNWGMAIVLDEARKSWRVTGRLVADLVQSQKYRIQGDLKIHHKHGEHLEASHIEPVIDDGSEALISYMQRIYEGCGKATAKRVLEWYQSQGNIIQLKTTLRERPWELLICPLVKGKFRQSVGKTKEQRLRLALLRDIQDLFQNIQLGDALLERLTMWAARQSGILDLEQEIFQDPDTLSKSIVLHIQENPYAPFGNVAGYDFNIADRLGRKQNIPSDDPRRIAAITLHVINTGCMRLGNTYLSADEFRSQFISLEKTQLFDFRKIRDALPLIADKIRIQDGNVYPLQLYEAEQSLAASLSTRLRQKILPLVSSQEIADRLIVSAAKNLGIRLNNEQHLALLSIMTQCTSVHTITGGPGSGKTAIMEILAIAFEGKEILCCAPTGKAARVLSDRVSQYKLQPLTVHRLLEPSTITEDGFVFDRNKHNLLKANILIVDEAGMLDIVIAANLFEACHPDMHIIILGDPDQLPSVSPGNVLQDILAMPFDHHKLSKIHRNEGNILGLVYSVQQSIWPSLQDNFPDVVHIRGPVTVDSVTQEYLQAVKRSGLDQVALIVPIRKGSIEVESMNVTWLNHHLRNQINPHASPVGKTRFRLRDRVLIRKNMMIDKALVVNGSTGTITHAEIVNQHVKNIYIRLDDGETVRITGKDMASIDHAYALTVHAAQGSEYKEIVFVGNQFIDGFTTRSLLYTGISRARKKLTVLGDNTVFAKMANSIQNERKSGLIKRITNA